MPLLGHHLQRKWGDRVVSHRQRRTLKVDIVNTSPGRHKTHFIDATTNALSRPPLLPNTRRLKYQHTEVLQICSCFTRGRVSHFYAHLDRFTNECGSLL